LKQYPASKGKIPPEIQVQVDAYQKQLDRITERLDEHTDVKHTENEQTYKEARAAIAAGADPIKVKKRLAEIGLDPDKL
jgi:hypothetical protein